MNQFYLTDQILIRVHGEKSVPFLHGQLSNTIKGLKAGHGNYNLLLNTKGKVQADLHVIRGEGFCDLLIAKNLAPVVVEHLKKLAPLSRCELSEQTQIKTFHVLGIIGEWRDLETGATQVLNNFTTPVLVFRSDRLGTLGIDVLAPTETESVLKDFFKANAIHEISDQEAEAIRIQNGVPKVGVDVTDENLPQEGCLDHALNYEKGCYLGQEIIARLHYKGHVNKILARLVADGQMILAGDFICAADGKQKGVVTSSYWNEETRQCFLLGFVPYKEQAKSTGFLIKNMKVTIT